MWKRTQDLTLLCDLCSEQLIVTGQDHLHEVGVVQGALEGAVEEFDDVVDFEFGEGLAAYVIFL